MKKVLVLILVFGMASLANAGLIFNIDSQVGNVITVSVVADSSLSDTTWVIAADTSVATVAGGTPLLLDSFMLGDAKTAAFVTGLGASEEGIAGVIMSFSAPPPYAAGTYFGSITLTLVGGIGTINLYEVNGNNDVGTPVDTIVIPEPATMLILGLGGLFLHRRKK